MIGSNDLVVPTGQHGTWLTTASWHTRRFSEPLISASLASAVMILSVTAVLDNIKVTPVQILLLWAVRGCVGARGGMPLHCRMPQSHVSKFNSELSRTFLLHPHRLAVRALAIISSTMCARDTSLEIRTPPGSHSPTCVLPIAAQALGDMHTDLPFSKICVSQRHHLLNNKVLQVQGTNIWDTSWIDAHWQGEMNMHSVAVLMLT